jgi:hypothetical protein
MAQITRDLKLLVDVAWLNRSAQTVYKLSSSEYAAADRLCKHGLLMNGGAGIVGITDDGSHLVKTLCDRIRKGPVSPRKKR